ncbi:hypothetical protein D9M68_992110 [compost metagenome]
MNSRGADWLKTAMKTAAVKASTPTISHGGGASSRNLCARASSSRLGVRISRPSISIMNR